MTKLSLYLKLIRLDKPIGILLLLWPTLWALWLAASHFKLSIDSPAFIELFSVFLLGTILMRSAGCAVNDIADRNFDTHVQRTSQRVLATGAISVREALFVATLCVLTAGSLALLYLNKLAILLCIPAALIAAAYPFFKRFFAIPQAILGLAFGFGIPIAYAAIENKLPFDIVYLFLANFFWVLSYDTLYAMSDKPDDLKLGINTSAIFLGRYDALGAVLFKLFFYGLLSVVLFINKVGLIVWVGFFISIIYSARLLHCLFQAKRNMASDSLSFRTLCLDIFLKNSHIGLIIWLSLILDSFKITLFSKV